MRSGMVSVSFVALLVGAFLLGGCGKQSEGQVCDRRNANDDCEGGLVCTSEKELLDDSNTSAERCCPPAGESVTDARCRRSSIGETDVQEPSSSGGRGSESPCGYDSECNPGKRCGPKGMCIPECLGDRDCVAPLICNVETNTCVSASSATDGPGGNAETAGAGNTEVGGTGAGGASSGGADAATAPGANGGSSPQG